MRNDRTEFIEDFYRVEGEYSSDYSIDEPGVLVPNKPIISEVVVSSPDNRYAEYKKENTFISIADKSNAPVIKRLKEKYKDDLGGAIYLMTLNIGYDWMRQHELLTSAGFSVTRPQIKELVSFCLKEYRMRRYRENLAFL